MATESMYGKEELTDYLEYLECEGYQDGSPNWGLFQDGGVSDEAICADATCDNCHHKGMVFRGMTHYQSRTWKAFSICPECGSGFEY